MKSWRSSKMKIGSSLINGQGNVACEDIKAHEILAVRSGHIISVSQALELVPSMGYVFLQLSEDLALSPLTFEEIPVICCFWNHSCEANVGIRGDVCFVAMRDIKAGDELTIDYATIAAHPLDISCTCKSPICRKHISGNDWKIPSVQKQYRGFFSTYVQSCINNNIN